VGCNITYMKRFQIVLIVIPLLYWAGCGDNDNGDNEGNPVIPGRTIYIVGSDDDGAVEIETC